MIFTFIYYIHTGCTRLPCSVAKMHRKLFLYGLFSAKENYNYWLFCGKRPATYGILCIFATLYEWMHAISIFINDRYIIAIYMCWCTLRVYLHVYGCILYPHSYMADIWQPYMCMHVFYILIFHIHTYIHICINTYIHTHNCCAGWTYSTCC